jgi:DNA repair protein RadD
LERYILNLRPYQAEAVNAVYQHLATRDDNPCVVIPTAGGKTPILATICRDAVQRWGGRVLVLAHVKELLEQAVEKLQATAPDLADRVGVYSAGLKSRDTEHPIIVAGIQSVYKKACDLGPFDLILIDEAHMIPPGNGGGGEGMYQTFLTEAKVVNPNVRLIGLTATPYRMTTGTICADDHLLNHVCFEVGVRELIVQGYLCPLKSKAGKRKPDTSGLHLRGGEFIAGEVEALMDDDTLVGSACREIIELTAERNSVLIFAAGLAHAQHIQRVMQILGFECGLVSGDTLPFERKQTLERFLTGELKYLVNVNVLTTGFDAPNIDCVALLRPTNSPGLYYQMVGRGFRLHPSKEDCLVLDFAGNIMRHGPVDMLQVDDRDKTNRDRGASPAKECPKCQAVVHAAYSVCPDCGHQFPPPQREKHEDKATNEGILSGQTTDTTYPVSWVCYAVHTKRGADETAPKTMRVEYQVNLRDYHSEWICFEHPRNGFARLKAEQWWQKRSHEPVPDTAIEAVELAENGALAETTAITVRSTAGEKYDRIVDHEFGPIPPRLDGSDETDDWGEIPDYETVPEDDIPF